MLLIVIVAIAIYLFIGFFTMAVIQSGWPSYDKERAWWILLWPIGLAIGTVVGVVFCFPCTLEGNSAM